MDKQTITKELKDKQNVTKEKQSIIKELKDKQYITKE